jgi:epoxyqueuosine reductase
MRPETVKKLAAECGFELAGIARAVPLRDAAWFLEWAASGMAGEMAYLTDYRADRRVDPAQLLPSVKSIICVGKVYNTPEPYSTAFDGSGSGWISRYAWGDDYHDTLRAGLTQLAARLQEAAGPFEHKICVDTAPLLERSYARMAGLGWIGKNKCLINQQLGSWIFLGELLVSLDIDPDTPAPDRCGTCTRCIQACPTDAIVPGGPGWMLDARRCISYFTIELRGAVPQHERDKIGNHVFGCDICQDVCPWNSKAAFVDDPAFGSKNMNPPLDHLAAMTEDEFQSAFAGSPVNRTRYSGFLRNVAIAMGNSGQERFREPLEKLAQSADPLISEHAQWALGQLKRT